MSAWEVVAFSFGVALVVAPLVGAAILFLGAFSDWRDRP